MRRTHGGLGSGQGAVAVGAVGFGDVGRREVPVQSGIACSSVSAKLRLAASSAAQRAAPRRCRIHRCRRQRPGTPDRSAGVAIPADYWEAAAGASGGPLDGPVGALWADELPGILVPTAGVLISDGGLATELGHFGHDLSDDLWSARLLAEVPDEIVAVHGRSSAPGRTSRPPPAIRGLVRGICGAGVETRRADRLMRHRRRLARSARGAASAPAWVAASVGPYRAMLAQRGVRRPLRAQRLPSWRRGTGRGWRC